MTVAEYIASLSIETLGLMIAGAALTLLVIILHVKNLRMMREVAASQANLDTKSRIDRLIASVERMNKSGERAQPVRAIPLNKSRKFVPAVRSAKSFKPRKRAS